MSQRSREVIHVLHVDDKPAFTDMVAEFLEREENQFTVETATSVSEGTSCLVERDFDCIVSDYEMADQNGLEFLETVRADQPDIPFILFTGKGSEEVASEAISASVTDYMQKGTGSDQYTVLANRIKNSVEQYRAKREANQTQKRLQELTESTPDCMWMFTSDWEELLFISGYEEVWDRPATTVKENPQDFLNGVYSGDQERVSHAMDCLSNGDPIDIEYRIQRGDDSIGWIWVKGKPIFDDNGDVVRVVGFTRDITSRKDHEQELERTTERMEFALQSTNAGIWELEPKSQSITGYPTPCPIFGQEFDTTEELLEKIHPEDQSKVEAALQTAIETGEEATLEFRPVPEIDAAWIESQTKPIKDDDGSVSLLTGLLRDISERKEHEQRLNSLHDATTDLIQADTQDAIAEIAVETVHDILDLPISAIWFHDESDNTLKPATLTDEGADLVDEAPVFEPGNNLAWEVFQSQEYRVFENVASHPERYNPETPIRSEIILPLGDHGVLIIGSTAVEKFDETDVSLAQILAMNVEEALTRADGLQQLIRQHERLDEFTSVVSHDLRNPLNVAKGRLKLAQMECNNEHLEEVADAHERMQMLIENLLTLAREGESVTETQSVVLKEIAETSWNTVATDSATLVINISQTIKADQSRLQQLFENLFRNAVDHGNEDVTVTVGELDNGFYIADDGPGIPISDREAVFEQGYSTTPENTGFGLAIVKTIAEAHGWDIRVTDSDDDGARFEITGIKGIGERSAASVQCNSAENK